MGKSFLPASSLRGHWYPPLSARLSVHTICQEPPSQGLNSHAHFTDRELRLMQPEQGLLGRAQSLRWPGQPFVRGTRDSFSLALP